MIKKIELLMPAGDLKRLKAALLYGADAVFIGGKNYSLRAKASNFSLEDIDEGVRFAHTLGKKVYVTVNMIPHSKDLEGIEEYLIKLDKYNVDAIIVSSPYIIRSVQRLRLNLECHLSTQVSALNSETVRFYESLGCSRVVLARECTLEDIQKISRRVRAELEVFIQGGLCSSYSGRCTLSNYYVLRDANRGGCAHSCRWDYCLFEGDNRISSTGPFKIASKDLIGVRHIASLIDAGVSSLKVEGRMKSLNYVAIVAKVYREIIDSFYDGSLTEKKIIAAEKLLNSIESRPLCEGFLNEKGISADDQIYTSESKTVNQNYLGYIEEYNEKTGMATIIRKNDFYKGDTVVVFAYDRLPFECTIQRLFKDNEEVESARCTERPIQAVMSSPVCAYYILRKKQS